MVQFLESIETCLCLFNFFLFFKKCSLHGRGKRETQKTDWERWKVGWQILNLNGNAA